MKEAAETPLDKGGLKGILEYTEDPIVSSDIIGEPAQLDLRRRSDRSDRRQPDQGDQLVRQRMGLQQPHRRPDRADRKDAVEDVQSQCRSTVQRYGDQPGDAMASR